MRVPTKSKPRAAVRCVVKWPPGLIAAIREAAADEGISAWVTAAALAVMTRAEIEAVQTMATELQAFGAEQVRLGNRVKHLRVKDPALSAQLADELVEFEAVPVNVSAADVEMVAAAAAGAGFLRHDQPQPKGSPFQAAQARSYVAFLRAAAAVEVSRK